MNEQGIARWANEMMATAAARDAAANAATVTGLMAVREKLGAAYIEAVHQHDSIEDGTVEARPGELQWLAGRLDGLTSACDELDRLLAENVAAKAPHGDN